MKSEIRLEWITWSNIFNFLSIYFSVVVLQSRLPRVAADQCNHDGAWPTYRPDEATCPQLGDHVIQQPYTPWGIPNRAWLTVPPELQIRQSSVQGAGFGTFATTHIANGTWLGEYEGEIFTPAEGDYTTAYSWVVYRAGQLAYYSDSARIDTSNWTRWVNCPRTPQEENVQGVMCMGRLLYVTIKPIRRGDELFVYYGHDYAHNLGVDVTLFGAPKPSDNAQYTCGCG